MLLDRIDGAQKDVPEMVVLALLIDELDDVEAELRFDDLRNLSGPQFLQRGAERRVEFDQPRRLHLAAAHHCTRILRVHAGQILELGVARDGALAHVEQPFARTLLGLGHRLGKLRDLRIDVLLGHRGQAVARERLVEPLDLARNDRHLVHHRALHLAGILLLLVTLAHDLANAEHGHVLLGFQQRQRPLLGDQTLQLILHGRENGPIIDLYRVDLRLVIEQLLGHQGFQRLVVRVAVGGVTLLTALLREHAGILVHLRIENRRTAHHGHHLVEHHLPFLGRDACAQQRQRHEHDTFLEHAISDFFKFLLVRPPQAGHGVAYCLAIFISPFSMARV